MGLSSKESQSAERGKEGGEERQGWGWVLLPTYLGDPLSQKDGVGTAIVACKPEPLWLVLTGEFRKASMCQV